MARTERALRARYVRTSKPSKLVVDFACDGLDPSLAEVAFESGTGHGFGLSFTRVQLGADDEVTLRRIAYQANGPHRVTVHSARGVRSQLTSRLESVRTALLARPHLIPLLDTRAPRTLRGQASGSTRDLHLALRLTDTRGRVAARAFTGYESSDNQDLRLPLEIAAAPLAAWLDGLAWTPVAIDEFDRAWFTERLRDAPRAEWWVRERMVAMAGALGTAAAIPSLLTLLPPQDDEEPSAQRLREDAVAALAQLTGWDPRREPAGAAAAADEADPARHAQRLRRAAARFLEACAR